jgi:tellurite resistance protein TehA-like permease
MPARECVIHRACARAQIDPAAGAVVMGTGIVSIALTFDGLQTLSRVLLGLAALDWAALGVVLIERAVRERDRLRREARTPAALTGVAATAVLGTRVAALGWAWVGVAFLGAALVLWCVLLAPVLAHWATPTVGVSLMLAVSTESLAVLAATIAERERAPWLLDAALVPFVLGLGFYAYVMAGFDLHELMSGRGDQWVTGGALAISTLAAGRIALAANALGALDGVHAALRLVSVVLWAITVAWLPVLLGTELLRPRLGYDVRRWSTVFPIGMYAACSYVVGAAAAAPAVTEFGRVWTWAGVAVWVLVAAATLHRMRSIDSRRMRETCICETPTTSPISLCVMSWSKRSRRIKRDR